MRVDEAAGCDARSVSQTKKTSIGEMIRRREAYLRGNLAQAWNRHGRYIDWHKCNCQSRVSRADVGPVEAFQKLWRGGVSNFCSGALSPRDINTSTDLRIENEFKAHLFCRYRFDETPEGVPTSCT